MSSYVDVNIQLEKLVELFKQKNWLYIEGSDTKIKRCQQLLQRFNSQDEQRLILDMLEKFNVVDYTNYYSCFNEIFHRINVIEGAWFQNLEKIAIVPLLKPKSIEKNEMKSSRFIWYLLKNVNFFGYMVFDNKTVSFIDVAEKGKISSLNSYNQVFLVDDYIGSGDTAISAIEYLIKNGVANFKITVVAIAAQKEGIQALKQYGVRFYYLETVSKAISDEYPESERECALELMRTIEGRYGGINKKYSLGYKQSEALWSLIRTPNNTLPIFWLKNIAPFERKK